MLVSSWLMVPSGLTEEKESGETKLNSPKSSAVTQLMSSTKTLFAEDLKALAEIVVEPKDAELWKTQGLASPLFPKIFSGRTRRLPKFFVLNLFNPLAGKEYGYVDPLKPFHGRRPGQTASFDVKKSEISGIPVLGRSW